MPTGLMFDRWMEAMHTIRAFHFRIYIIQRGEASGIPNFDQ